MRSIQDLSQTEELNRQLHKTESNLREELNLNKIANEAEISRLNAQLNELKLKEQYSTSEFEKERENLLKGRLFSQLAIFLFTVFNFS
jgi:hypothetical protein